jgi:hypothetical protein
VSLRDTDLKHRVWYGLPAVLLYPLRPCAPARYSCFCGLQLLCAEAVDTVLADLK